MTTLPEIKAGAAALPAEERHELLTWLGESEDVSQGRREKLRREIQIGLDQIERGEVGTLDIAEIKRRGAKQPRFSRWRGTDFTMLQQHTPKRFAFCPSREGRAEAPRSPQTSGPRRRRLPS